jgi:hypothetical protein
MRPINKALLLSIVVIICNHANAQAIFTPDERKAMLNYSFSNLEMYKDDEKISNCKEQARLGSDEALSAIFILAKNTNAVDNISKQRQAAISAGKSNSEQNENLKKTITKENIQSLQKSIILIPKSTKYCNDLYIKTKKAQ